MCEEQIRFRLLQVRLHLDDPPQKLYRLLFALEINPPGFPPLHQPLQQLRTIQRDQLRLRVVVMPDTGRPPDKRPVVGGKQFLLVGGSHGQVSHVVQCLHAIASAGAYDVNLHPELVQSRQLRVFNKAPHHTQRGTGRVEMNRRWREHPFLEALEKLMVFFSLLHLGKAREVGVRHQLVGHRAPRLHEHQRQVLESNVPAALRHAAPPVVLAKILAGQVELVEIILQQKPRTLRIVARRKNLQQLGPLGHVLLGFGQLVAQVGEVAVGVVDDSVVRVVLGRFR